MSNPIERRGARPPVIPAFLLASGIAFSAVVQPGVAHAESTIVDMDFSIAPVDGAGPALAVTETMLASTASLAGQQPTLEAPLYRAELDDPDGEGERSLARPIDRNTRLSFGQQIDSIKWEIGAGFAYMTAVNVAKLVNRGRIDSFSFKNEGFFGKDTDRLGVDKLTHAHNTHILTDIYAARIRAKTGTTRGTAMTGAVVASGLMLYSEVFDGFKAGFGVQDLVFNSLGAGFSVLRDTTPGLEEKLDFRVLILPNGNLYSPVGGDHYDQLRYLFALKPSGFPGLRDTPARFIELQAGYYATGLSDRDEELGRPRKRKLFAGIGINLSEILFGRAPTSRVGKAGAELLDYWQPPHTYVHVK